MEDFSLAESISNCHREQRIPIFLRDAAFVPGYRSDGVSSPFCDGPCLRNHRCPNRQSPGVHRPVLTSARRFGSQEALPAGMDNLALAVAPASGVIELLQLPAPS